ncbi:IspD/TarI family cytidylyltransferase, partial [Veillonella sp.]|uniref:IspD/TarI family cytidylyltransferase n=1 Tax=Veillonella sp. TaxID=1926307 RepID=UPI0025DC9A99
MKKYAVIFAGGTGQRMNTKSKPKQFLLVHGKPVLIYTLEKFQLNQEIDGIILVCLESWIDYATLLCEQYKLNKIIKIVPGGSDGQESIFNGLLALKDIALKYDIILIHDGVRPLISSETISRCIKSVQENGNAITVAPAIETVFIKSNDNTVGKILNREQCFMAKAPQCFIFDDIFKIHQLAIKESKKFIDSASMMLYYGKKLFTIEGFTENIKITTPADFYIF